MQIKEEGLYMMSCRGDKLHADEQWEIINKQINSLVNNDNTLQTDAAYYLYYAANGTNPDDGDARTKKIDFKRIDNKHRKKYLIINTIHPDAKYDTFMLVQIMDKNHESIMGYVNDNIDNDKDAYGLPQNFSKYGDIYKKNYHFEMSSIDIDVDLIPDDGYVNVSIVPYDKESEFLKNMLSIDDKTSVIITSSDDNNELHYLQVNYGIIDLDSNHNSLNIHPINNLNTIDDWQGRNRYAHVNMNFYLNDDKTLVNEYIIHNRKCTENT